MLLDDDEIEALSIAAAGGAVANGGPRALPLQLGRSDQELSRAAAFLDIHVRSILRRLKEAVRHQTRRQIEVEDAAPRLMPVQDLLVSDSGGPMVVVELGAGIGLPGGLLVMNDSSARALALMAIAPTSAQPTAMSDVIRPLSPAERRLLARFLASMLTSLGLGLPRDVPAQPLRLIKVHADPREMTSIDRSANMIALAIVFTGDLSARIEIAMPSSWLVTARGAPARPRARSGRRLGSDHSQIIVQVSAELGRTQLTLRRLLALSPGDLVLLQSSPKALVPVLIQGLPRLTARAEVRDGRVAMVIASGTHRAEAHAGRGPRDLNVKDVSTASQSKPEHHADVAVDVGPADRSLVSTLATTRPRTGEHHG